MITKLCCCYTRLKKLKYKKHQHESTWISFSDFTLESLFYGVINHVRSTKLFVDLDWIELQFVYETNKEVLIRRFLVSLSPTLMHS